MADEKQFRSTTVVVAFEISARTHPMWVSDDSKHGGHSDRGNLVRYVTISFGPTASYDELKWHRGRLIEFLLSCEDIDENHIHEWERINIPEKAEKIAVGIINKLISGRPVSIIDTRRCECRTILDGKVGEGRTEDDYMYDLTYTFKIQASEPGNPEGLD